jgi:xanthine dehydrogenase accessory factor
MDWLRAAELLRARREAGVLITVLEVRGHAPREAGAKMVVSASELWGTIGGGNLEATALQLSRELLRTGGTAPEQHELALSPRAPGEHGAQCCGGRVRLMLEPLPAPPTVAVFGLGHVGLELARILARQDLDLELVDSRPDRLTAEVLLPLQDALARVHPQHAPEPDSLLGTLPSGAHAVILTHDHAQDLALCDAALRHGRLGSIGLIGSPAKWRQFRTRLAEAGHPPESVAGIRTPIGLPEVPGKDPASIAVSIAGELLSVIHQAAAAAHPAPRPVVDRSG